MAFFNFDQHYTQRELYDWVVTEMPVAREMGMANLTKFLDLFQKSMNKANQDQGRAMWIPSVPTAENIQKVKGRMKNFSKKVLHKTTDIEGEDTTDIPFTGHAGKCPECHIHKSHLKAHLLSHKHQWTQQQYNDWRDSADKPLASYRQEKTCHHVTPQGKKYLAW